MIKRFLAVCALLCLSAVAHGATQPILQPRATFVDGSGAPCSGCSLFSYAAGTTTPLPTYTDSTGVTQNTNPVVLDVAGGAEIWLGVNPYKFVLKDTLGGTIWSVDNVARAGLPLSGGTLTGPLFGTAATFSGAVVAASLAAPITNSIYYPTTLAKLQADVTACGSNVCTISVNAPIAVTGNYAVPANVSLQFANGGQLQPSVGVTLTVSGPVADGKAQIFGGAGATTGLTVVRPEWFGSTSLVPALKALSVNGGKVLLQAGAYQSGCCSTYYPITLSNVDIEGAGKSQTSADNTHLVGGTVIQGTLWANCNTGGGHADNFTLRNVGIDMGSNVTTAFYASVPGNAFVMDNNGQAIGGAQCQSPTIEHVTALASSASAPTHAFLFENADGGYLADITAINGTHGIAFKASNSVLNGFTSIGHNTDCLIVKADNYAPAFGDTISNGICSSFAQGDGQTNGIVLQAESAAMSDISLSNLTLGWVTNGIQLSSFTSSLANINISNVSVDFGGSTTPGAGSCFQTSGTTTIFSTNLNNLTCNNYTNLFNIGAFIQNGNFANIYGNNAQSGSVFSGVISVSNITQTALGGGFTSPVFSSSAATSVISIAYPQISGAYSTFTSTSAGALITVFPIMNTATGSINSPLFTGGPFTVQGIPATTYDFDVLTASGSTHAFRVLDNGNAQVAGSLTLTGGANTVYRCAGGTQSGYVVTDTTICTGAGGTAGAINLIVP